MKKTMLFMVIAILLLMPLISAKSGCCSYHGGVCGNKCCDGSPLSVACGGNGGSSDTQTTPVSEGETSYNNQSITCIEKTSSDAYCFGLNIKRDYQLSIVKELNN